MVDIGCRWLDWLWKQGDSVQTGLTCAYQYKSAAPSTNVGTVDICSVNSIARNWLRSARVDLHIVPTNRLKYRPRIVRRLIERSIAMNGAHAKQLNPRIVGA